MTPSILCKTRSYSLLRSSLFLYFQNYPFHHSSSRNPPRVNRNPTPKSARDHTISNRFKARIPTQFRDSDFQPESVLETLNCYGNDWKLALEFFNWAQTQSGFLHTTETYNRMIDILGKFFEFDVAWSLIERMGKDPSSLPNHTTFRVLCKRYISARLVKEAFDAFSKLNEYNLRDETSFSILIDSLCEYRHVIDAEDLCFKRNRDTDYNGIFAGFNIDTTKIYNMILRGFFKIEWWGKCRNFWEVMDKKGIDKDLFSYSIYMDIQCKSGKPWKAVKLFREMKRKGIKLDTVAYNTVVHAIGKYEGVDSSVKIYKQMIEAGCSPNLVTFNTILKLLCDYGRYREAHQMISLMSKKGCPPNVVTYNCLFSCLQKPGKILKLFDQMIRSGIRPRMDTYVMLMRKFGRWGFLRPALYVWEKMEELGDSPDEFAYNALIDTYIQKGLVDVARKYDSEMYMKGISAKRRSELWENADKEPSVIRLDQMS